MFWQEVKFPRKENEFRLCIGSCKCTSSSSTFHLNWFWPTWKIQLCKKLFLLIMKCTPTLLFPFHLCQCNAIQFIRVEGKTELGPQCPMQEEGDLQLVCQYDISYPQAYKYGSHCNSTQTNELQENILIFCLSDVWHNFARKWFIYH